MGYFGGNFDGVDLGEDVGVVWGGGRRDLEKKSGIFFWFVFLIFFFVPIRFSFGHSFLSLPSHHQPHPPCIPRSPTCPKPRLAFFGHLLFPVIRRCRPLYLPLCLLPLQTSFSSPLQLQLLFPSSFSGASLFPLSSSSLCNFCFSQ